LRIAVTDPDCQAAIESLIPLSQLSQEQFLSDMALAGDLLTRIQQEASGREGLEVRTYRFCTTLSFLMIDGHLPSGRIVVEMLPYQVSPPLKPHLFVTAKNNPTWFTYFRGVCESIWADLGAQRAQD